MITATSSATSTNAAQSPVKNKNFSLKTEDFIKMMITQLQNQDPMEPAKNQELLAQMSQIGQLQSATTLQSSLQTMVMQNQIGAAGNLIGKMIQGQDASANPVAGLVTSVRVDKDSVYLELDNGKTIPMGNVTGITGPTQATKN